MKIIRASLLVGAVLAISFAGRVAASDITQDLPIPGSDSAYHIVGCTDGWHFVHTGSTGPTFLPATLTATFQDGGVYTADGYRVGNSNVQYSVPAAETDVLVAASDTINNPGRLVLSHICVQEGDPTSEPSTTPSEAPDPSGSAEPSPTPSAQPSDDPSPEPSPSATPSEPAPSMTSSPTPSETSTVTERSFPTPPATDTESEDNPRRPHGLLLMILGAGLVFASVYTLTVRQAPRRTRR